MPFKMLYAAKSIRAAAADNLFRAAPRNITSPTSASAIIINGACDVNNILIAVVLETVRYAVTAVRINPSAMY